MYYYVVFNGFHVTEQKITSYSKNDKVCFISCSEEGARECVRGDGVGRLVFRTHFTENKGVAPCKILVQFTESRY